VGVAVEVRVGKRRTITIPKNIADALGITEGSRLKLEVHEDCIILKPVPDAIHLSVYGEKIAKISLRELEADSIAEQEKYAGEA
jgi:AbrB family looped-hinge helix DNA binding protein